MYHYKFNNVFRHSAFGIMLIVNFLKMFNIFSSFKSLLNYVFSIVTDSVG